MSATCQCIAVSAFTGEIGDGKIFVLPVADIIRMCETSLSASALYHFVCATGNISEFSMLLHALVFQGGKGVACEG